MAGRPPRAPLPEPSMTPHEGLHCSHYFYQLDHAILRQLDRSAAADSFQAALNPQEKDNTQRLQTYTISGHRADFCVMLMDGDPLKIDAVHQSLMASEIGPAIRPTWSFVSMSEVSEYVPTVEQFREGLIKKEGMEEGSEELEARVGSYAARLPKMNEQRLQPQFPDWPAACFYPMNKVRHVGANWFTEAFSDRRRMMSEHAESGIAFAGRVTQLISVGVGLDDWEWMVTLWARNPEYLKEIVYRMRFDEASAKYAEFGPFYTGYKSTTEEILRHCRII